MKILKNISSEELNNNLFEIVGKEVLEMVNHIQISSLR
jgi:hypothetical protein